MRRTDRLFEIIQILRDGKLHRAQDIAERLEVSTRTIYRDMDTLVASGVPVEGERGVGYMVREQISLPPLTLTPEELEALNLGMAIVAEAADPDLKAAALSLAARWTQCCRSRPSPRPMPGSSQSTHSRTRPAPSRTCPACAPPSRRGRNCS